MGRVWCLMVLLWLGGCATASQPFLRLETGGHTAAIRRIAVDAKGQFLVTGSIDKTTRVWRLADGVLLQTLRPPLGEGDEGKVYAVAIAPDGGVVAVGGFLGTKEIGAYLYLFDRASGRLLHAIGGLPDAIHDLGFSCDGRYLAATLGGANGIRVYRSADWQEARRDMDYQDGSYSADFDLAGRLLTTSRDGFIRLYDAGFKLLAERKAPGGNDPYQARFSPDGSKIAVGFSDSTAVNVLSGMDLGLLYAPNTQQLSNGNLNSVVWSADGSFVYAGGRYVDSSGWVPLMRWAEAGRGQAERFRVSTNTIRDLRALADGRLAFGAGDPVFGVLNRDGGTLWEHRADILDTRGNRDKLRVSQDGSQLEFGYVAFAPNGIMQNRLVYFDLAQRQPRFDQTPASDLTAPNTLGESSSNWQDTDHPQIHSQSLALERYERSWSLALSPQTPGFLLGTVWYLRYYDSPENLRWAVPIPDTAWAVNLSPDGRYAIAAYADGTIRWHKTVDGEEVLALFVHPDRKRWIAWTKEGFYDAAPGAESLIGYHLNQGREHEGRFIAAQQLEKRFYRSDLIASRLSPEGDRLIAAAAAKLGDVRQALADGLPPALELVSSRLEGYDLVLEYRVKPQDGGVGRIVYKVNGVEQEPRALALTTPGGSLPLKISLPLPAGQANKVEVAAFNSRNSIASDPLTVAQTTPAAAVKPRLYVLAVGVSQYKDKSLSLKYAAADARAVSAMLAQGGQALFDIAPPKILLDGQASLAGIRAAFEDLAAQVKENDVFLLYLAGHGAVFDGAYHFIPQDAIYGSEEKFRAASLNEQGFQDLLKTIRAQKSLILLDTCYAGAAMKLAAIPSGLVRGNLEEKTAITKLMRAIGRTVLMASSDKAMAFEGYKDHGFFSYALLQGLQGEADSNHNAEISTLELADFVSELVPKISQDRQFPIHESNGNTFPIGLSRVAKPL